jgi:hypothetical protein
MRSSFRNLVPLLLATGMAVPLLLAGCQTQAPASAATTQAAPQDDSYIRWEHETKREHMDVNKRSDDERKQYNDWKASQH